MSPHHHFTLLLLLFLLISSSSLHPSTATTITDFIFAVCSPTKYPPNSPDNLGVKSLLSSLSNSSSSTTYSNSSSPPSFGLFQCRNDLSSPDCTTCITAAIFQLSTTCPYSTAATVQLNGCFIRYDNNSNFIGAPDTTLLSSKCGAPSNYAYGATFLAMRDAALAGIVTGAQNYKVGGAGYVQAMAQCVGDLSSKDCDDCVAVAVAQLKSGCGFAVGGDVYLGKCYAKFWSAGFYPPVAHEDDDDDSDETGKTVAIIIGVIAGIALLVIFLSSLSKYGSGKS